MEGEKNWNAVEEIRERLGHLPLAFLGMAAAYMLRCDVNCSTIWTDTTFQKVLVNHCFVTESY
jgi:hypothetical protein